MIFFDIFNNTVNKGNIMILKIDYICFNSQFLFSLNNDICSITKWVFPVHLRSEFVKGKRYSVHIIRDRLGLEQFLDVKTTCSYPAIGEICIQINTGNKTEQLQYYWQDVKHIQFYKHLYLIPNLSPKFLIMLKHMRAYTDTQTHTQLQACLLSSRTCGLPVNPQPLGSGAALLAYPFCERCSRGSCMCPLAVSTPWGAASCQWHWMGRLLSLPGQGLWCCGATSGSVKSGFTPVISTPRSLSLVLSFHVILYWKTFQGRSCLANGNKLILAPMLDLHYGICLLHGAPDLHISGANRCSFSLPQRACEG